MAAVHCALRPCELKSRPLSRLRPLRSRVCARLLLLIKPPTAQTFLPASMNTEYTIKFNAILIRIIHQTWKVLPALLSIHNNTSQYTNPHVRALDCQQVVAMREEARCSATCREVRQVIRAVVKCGEARGENVLRVLLSF